MSVVALKQKNVDLLAEAKAIQEASDKAGEMSDENVEKIKSLVEQSKALKAKIKVQEDLATHIAELDVAEERAPDVSSAAAAPIPAVARDAREEGKYGWPRFGDFCAAVYRSHPQVNGTVDNRLINAAISGMSQVVPSEGGYTVPPTFATAIWDGLNRAPNNLMALTDQYTVQGESLTFNANAETSRVTTRYGGVLGYWLGEGDQVTASKPKFRQVRIEPHALGVFAYVTDKLLKNSAVALEQYLAKAATDEINFQVGNAIINGTGAGQPNGILKANALVSVTKETGQAAATVVAENLVKMWARCHPSCRSNAVWVYNCELEPQLLSLQIGTGATGFPVFMPPGGISGAQYSTLFGRPMIPIEYCPALGTVGDIMLIDFKSYITGVRGGVEAASSIHLRFDYNETAFRYLFEVDGAPWVQTALTPYKGSSTLSPFVALATRA